MNVTRTLHVFLDGTFIGELEQTRAGNTTFTYDDEYRRRDDATPLSLSMPVSRSTHPQRAVTPFLQGLLPDSAGRLDELSREYHTSASNTFGLLAHIGRDVAGAVQILRPDDTSSDALDEPTAFTPLTDSNLADIVANLIANADTWGADGSTGRWSLAGAQPKVALFRDEHGNWGVPEGGTPTTHILKPAVAPYIEHHVNEFVTMAAARQLGLDVAGCELLTTTKGDRAFVSARYDRVIRDGQWRRLHQEDFCQALSVDPARKYQSDGGPSIAQIARLIDTFPDLQQRRASQRRLFDALIFNASAANTDAHAKNYSILLRAENVELAPLYDLGTHLAYPSGQPLASAMRIGDDYRLSHISMRDLLKVAKSVRIPADEAEGRVDEIRSGLAAAFAASADTVSTTPEKEIAVRIADSVAAYVDERGW